METWDGGEGLGLALAPGIMARVIASAGRRGLGMAWLTGSSHFGLASYYTLAAASAGLAGLVMTNGHPAVAPPGAQAAVTGTNAVSLALPGEGKASLVIDLATSNTSLGNLEQRAAAGEKAPAHWAAEALQARLGLGPDDLADPEVLRSERMLSALGGGRGSDGYKGFALALLVESLTALLPGGRPSPKLGPGQACHFFLAISPGAVWAGPGAGVGPGASQDAEAGAAIDRAVSDLGGTLARTPVLGGYPPLRLPGRRGNLAEAERRVRGIPFPREVVSALVGLAEELGVDAGPLAEGLGVDAGRTPAPPVARPQSR
jgi:LDH2 family malate/lactate/ureidoglycolate dehydrogenase